MTASRFLNGLHGAYAESPDLAELLRRRRPDLVEPTEISGVHPSCTFQTTGARTECDEDQFSIPEVASDGTLYVHFLNGQNEADWEARLDLDNQIMVVKSTDGGATFGAPVAAAQLEDGAQRHAVLGHRPPDDLGPPDPLDVGREHLGRTRPTRRRDGRLVGPRHAEPERDAGCFDTRPG